MTICVIHEIDPLSIGDSGHPPYDKKCTILTIRVNISLTVFYV